MSNRKRIALLVVVFICCMVSFSFADDGRPSGFLGLIYDLIKWIPTALGDIINAAVKIKPETIYLGTVKNGALVKPSPFLFRFSLSNYFGGYSSTVYALTSYMATILVSIIASITAVKLLLSNTAQAKKNAVDSVKVLFIGVITFWFLPDLINFIFGIRDKILLSLHYLFSGGADIGFIDQMKVLATNGGIIEAAIYFAGSVFTLWLLGNYVGLGFGFSAILFIFPILLVISPAMQTRKVVDDFRSSILSYIATPILDIGLLGVVSTVIARPVSELSGLPTIIPHLMNIVVVMSVIPIRSTIKQKFGWGNAVGDMVGAGMLITAAGMMTRVGKGASNKFSGKGQSQNGPNYEEQSEYHKGLEQMRSSSGGEQSVSGTPGEKVSADLPPIDFNKDSSPQSSVPPVGQSPDFNREQFINEHMGKSHFNPRDIQMTDGEKANMYQELANRQKAQNSADKGKAILNNIGRTSAGSIGGFVGGTAGLFMGPAAVAAGAYMGASAGSLAYDKASKLAPHVQSAMEHLSSRIHQSPMGQEAEAIIEQAPVTDLVQSQANDNFDFEFIDEQSGVNTKVHHGSMAVAKPILEFNTAQAAGKLNDSMHKQYCKVHIKRAEVNIANDPLNTDIYLAEMNKAIEKSNLHKKDTEAVLGNSMNEQLEKIMHNTVQSELASGKNSSPGEIREIVSSQQKITMASCIQSMVEYGNELALDFNDILVDLDGGSEE